MDAVLLTAISYLQQRGDVVALWLYGSRAQGTHCEDSDYDLAVAFTEVGKRDLQGRLRPEQLAFEIADATGLQDRKISVVDINLAPLHLCFAIVKRGYVLWTSDDERVTREEIRVSRLYEDEFGHA